MDLPNYSKKKPNPTKNTKIKNLDLTPTPILHLPKDEIIFYFKDRLYFLTTPYDKISNEEEINILGKNYGLIDSESFLDLEKDYLEENKKNINSFKVNYLKRLIEKGDLIKKEYNFLEKSLKEDDSLDSVVQNYFFPITKGTNIEKIISDNKREERFEKEINMDKIRNTDFTHNTSFFKDLFLKYYGYSSFLVTDNKCYKISNKMNFMETTKELERKYKEFVREKIKRKTKKNINSYIEELLQKDEHLENLRERISSVTFKPHKDFGADRISENEYILFKNIGRYGVEWKGDFYLFSPIKVGVGLTKTFSGYKIDEKGFAYKNPYYKHPYIQGEKGRKRREICTAGKINKIHSQINFGSKANKEGKAELMKSAKRLLERFEDILKRGHNSNHEPIDTIQESAQLISKREAEKLKIIGIEFFPKKYGN